MGAAHLTLASASPRRRELLARLGLAPDAVTPADIDETPRKEELPRAYALRMGREKALAVDAPGFVLAGDTVVAVGRRILPKTETEAEARACLELMSGRRHQVAAYLAGGEWQGKAGGYAIQGAAEGLIAWIRGSHSGVMGLPLYHTRALLKAAGFQIG